MNVDWAWLRRVQGSKSKFSCVILFALLLPSTALAGWQYHVGYWIWNAYTYSDGYSSCADPEDCVSVYETKQNIYYQNAGKPAGLPQLVLSCAVGDTAPPASWPYPTFSGRFTCKTTWWWLTVNGSWEAIRTIETCPDNMSGTPCACIAGFVPNPAGAGCVLPACPEHANRASPDAPCACEADYEFDAAGTSCVAKAVCTAVTKLDDPKNRS